MSKNWEMVIGLEVHVELSTKSKIFCSCTTQFGGEPNTHCCPVCTGMPGTLPIFNGQVLEYAVKAGLALNCEIERQTRFDRKNYFYPDLPKAYQISQLYRPIAHDGYVEIETSQGPKKIRIHEMHMEEDAGKLIHSEYGNETYPDYNRCGVPLLEIVSEPDFRSAEEVAAYLEKIRMMFTYLGISDCKMQEGSMRADVNLSIREAGTTGFGTRTEMKNINSISAIERAIAGEYERQCDLLESGGKVTQETRHWNDDKKMSTAMRSKENAQDYRYFPEPDIPEILVSEEYIDDCRSRMPEFAPDKKERFMSEYGLSEYDAGLLVASKPESDFFEALIKGGATAKASANWLIVHLASVMKKLSADINGTMDFEDAGLDAEQMSYLIKEVEGGKVNRQDGIDILTEMVKSEEVLDVKEYIASHGLEVSNDTGALAETVAKVIAANEQAVSEYKSGKEKAIGFLVGACMKELKGKCNPGMVKEMLEAELKK